MTEETENKGSDEAKTEAAPAPAPAPAPESADGAKPKAKSGGFTRRVFSKGEVLAKEGERGESAYVIKTGKVEIRKGARTPNPRVLNTLGPGNVVAEFALFDGLSHSADVIAMEETEVVALSRAEFETRVHTIDPVLRTAVMGIVTKARDMVSKAGGGDEAGWSGGG